jgi:hypothetical protein
MVFVLTSQHLFRLFVALTGIQYAGGHLQELQRAVKVIQTLDPDSGVHRTLKFEER